LTHAEVDADLTTIARYLHALPAATARWRDPHQSADERDRDRQAFDAEWADLVLRFEDLATVDRARALTASQAASLRETARALRAALATLRRWKLDTPPRGLLDRLAPAPAEESA
jgi:hypothetical protein